MRTLLSAFIAILICVPAAAQDEPYAVGDVWSYDAAPEDAGSLIKIKMIEEIGSGEDLTVVYHISMIAVAIPGQDNAMEIGHLPVSEMTLDNSVSKRVVTDLAFPDHREGRGQWVKANGGVFTISLKEIAAFLRNQVLAQISGEGPR